jgi:hypothetical protein
MDLIRKADLNDLIEGGPGPCVSIFLPTHRAGPATEQDRIRLKNLLRKAEGVLLTSGERRAPAVRELLAPARDLERERLFWEYQSDGLAVFIRPGWFRFYRIPLSLPSVASVGDRHHVAPLLPLFTGDGHFFVLALSQNEIRLLGGSRHSVEHVELSDVPTSLADALRYEDREKQHLFHVAGGGARSGRAIFHGHGIGGEVGKDQILRYFRQVDRGLRELLADERAPLVLAGVEYLLPIYREATTYPHLVDVGIAGNPEGLSDDHLHGQAWALIEPVFRRERQQAAARYRDLAGTGLGPSELVEVLQRSHEGRVEVLFIAVGEQQWGAYDAEAGTVALRDQPEAKDEDVLNLAAVRTLQGGGVVYAVGRDEMPAPGSLAAVLRY